MKLNTFYFRGQGKLMQSGHLRNQQDSSLCVTAFGDPKNDDDTDV